MKIFNQESQVTVFCALSAFQFGLFQVFVILICLPLVLQTIDKEEFGGY